MAIGNLLGKQCNPTECRSIYVRPNDRYVVSLVSSYGNDHDRVTSPEQAVAAALALTLDAKSGGTLWFCCDRVTGEIFVLEQKDIEEICYQRGFIG